MILNRIWLGMLVFAGAFGVMNGKTSEVVVAVTESAKMAFEFALSLAGVMAFWLGLMNVAKDAGLLETLARLLLPIMRVLFPEIPPAHPAIGAMVMNLAANMLGLANAATPFGLEAMRELQTLNPMPNRATHAMCMFLALNTSSVQLIPASAMAFLIAAGAHHPSDIMLTTMLATICSTIVAISVAIFLSRLGPHRVQPYVPES